MQRFNDNKAGMAGLDKEKIQKIIEENTSANYEGHSKKQIERIEARIKHNDAMLKTFTPQQIAKAESEMDAYVDLLEEERDLSRIAIHVDMDAFYAAVEMRDDPSLRTIPMAVGGDSMLSTSNYVARRFGVRAAMPGFIARKLCPELKIIPCNFSKYKAASKQARKVFEEYDPNFSMGSLDEAYLDITDCVAKRIFPVERERLRYTGDCICRLPLIPDEGKKDLSSCERVEKQCEKCGKTRIKVRDSVSFGTDVDEIVQEMRFRVEQATGLTCSAGIAPNSMIAKICSDMNKPNGQFRISNDKETVLNFMRNLPIRKVCGIGAVTEAILKGLGVERCGDLYEKRASISLLFTQRSYEHFLRIALGISNSYTAFFTTDRESRRKSIGNETTFHPTGDMKALLEIMKGLCVDLIEQLPKRELVGGRSATVKMKFSTFDLITRCTTVDNVIMDSDRLYSICERVIHEELRDNSRQLRLLGVQLSKLVFVGDKALPGVSKTLSSYFSAKKGEEHHSESDGESDIGANFLDTSMSRDGENSNCEAVPGCSKTSDMEEQAKLPRTEEIAKSPRREEKAEPSEKTPQLCPICNARLPEELLAINHHIDECLNRKAISNLQEEECRTMPKAEAKTPSKDAQKRRRTASKKKSVPGAPAKKTRNISDYFSRT